MLQLHHVVIVGGGAGGLELTTQLGDTLGKAKKIKITLIDQKLTHIWKPLLHEIAAGTLNPHQEEINYYAHAAKHHYQFVLGRLSSVDHKNKKITVSKQANSKYEQYLDEHLIEYDTLILALGSVSNDFATPGVKTHCHYLDSPRQAQSFQQDLLNLYLDAQSQAKERELHIGIIGAGATGVELAAELVQSKRNFYRYGLNKINPDNVKITLIEAADRILPALSVKMAEHSQKQLNAMGVDILTHKRVEKVDQDYIHFSDGSRIHAELKVWSAGIKTPKVITEMAEFKKDRMGRLEVFATLQSKTDANIFVIGDCAHCVLDATAPALAPRAQVASQQASFMLEAIKARLKGRSQPMFHFSDKGSLVSLSENQAVGELLGQVNVQGLVAKSMYVSLYRMHQATINGYLHTSLFAIKDFVTRKVMPKIKLH